MAGELEVDVTFDIDVDDYGSFITDLRKKLANHPDHQSDTRAYGDWLKVHPLLPKQESADKPAGFIYIKISGRGKGNEKGTTILAFKADNFYFIGFRNQEKKWYEFGKNHPEQQKQQEKDHLAQVKQDNNNQQKKQKACQQVNHTQKQKKNKANNKKNIPTDERLIDDSTFLGYKSLYGALVGSKSWEKTGPEKIANLGESTISNAVFRLSTYGIVEKDKQPDHQCIKNCLAKLIVIVCESARMFPLMERVKGCWDVNDGSTTLTADLWEYMHSWENMSKKMLVSVEDPPCKVNIGTTTNMVEACTVVHLILHSGKTKEAIQKKSACPNHGETGEEDDPASSGGGGNPKPPPKEDGSSSDNSSFQEENGNDDKDRRKQPAGGSHQGKTNQQHNGEAGQQQRKQHGLCLVEVFALRHTHTAGSPFVGRISIFDARRGQIIYWNEQNEVAPSKDKEGNLLLTGPYIAISAGGKVALKITRTAEQVPPVTLPMWDPYTESSEDDYDKIISKNIPGGLELSYAALSNAVEATVQLQVFLRRGDTASVYGEITAQSNLASVVLFSCGIEDEEELTPSYDGSTVEFTRSVVAWSVGQPLLINLEKLQLTVDGTPTRFKERQFTFWDHTDRVCFTTLEGNAGYARVSVDDTGEYRDETKKWLPRSLRFKMNTPHTSIETELLIFTFEKNNPLPSLLHLTNKSGDQHVAFRCCPGQQSAVYFNDISEISVILPPDSTSTYLVELKGPFHQAGWDALSLILESCVALKKDDEEEDEDDEDEDVDVDEIFSKQTRAGIHKVTLKTTGAADKTMISEIIPHSLNQEEPPLQGNMQKQLPKHVVFKGDNGNYMAAVTPPGEDYVFLQFNVYPQDKNDKRCSHTIYPNSDGTIRIKSDYYGKFWRRSPNWIWVDSDDQSSNNPDTLFRPVKLDGEGMYALQNVGNDNYCHRLTCDYKQSCLNASSPYIHNEACLKMEEAVLSRRIYDVRYRTEDAKIQGKKLNTLITQEAVNRGSRYDKETLSLNYNVSRETKWDSSASIKLGVTTTIEAGIPEVASASVEVSSEFSYSQSWGQAVIRTEGYSTTYEVTVPPGTKVTVSMLATEATCEVPFSYAQEDVLSSGEKVVYKFNDGIYRGVNNYGFKVDVMEEKL